MMEKKSLKNVKQIPEILQLCENGVMKCHPSTQKIIKILNFNSLLYVLLLVIFAFTFT